MVFVRNLAVVGVSGIFGECCGGVVEFIRVVALLLIP